MSYGIQKQLTKQSIYEKINSYDIFKKYCVGFTEPNKAFKSPLRDTDNNPSSYVIFYQGDWLFNDFGKGSYRAIDFVMELFKISYDQALQQINYDFNLDLGPSIGGLWEYKPLHIDKVSEKMITEILIKKRSWEEHDITYWHSNYRITLDALTRFNVYPISGFSINGIQYIADKHAYSYNYYWENDIFRRKIYQPFSKINKWFSNGGAIVQGEGVLPRKGDLLIITSSLKDVMTLYEMGYIAIAPTSETSFVPTSYFVKQKDRFERIIIFMDSDKAGMEANERLSKKWGLDYISIPISYESKDISDLVKNYDQETAKKLLNDKIYKTM
jgi:5S rRNA maturation endonuclease (ribonuclease M5)